MKTLKKILSAFLSLMLFIPSLSVLAFANGTEDEASILSQPSSKNPTFLLENANGASYEWYEVTYENHEITDESQGIQGVGTYDSEEGAWIASLQDSSLPMFFIFKPLVGERIFIEYDPSLLASDFALYTQDGEYIYFEPAGRGKASVIVPESKFYYLSCNPAIKDPRVKSYKSVANEPSLLAGQSTATLKEYEIGKTYFAKATVESGEAIYSEQFIMDYEIASHPSVDSFSIITNCDGDVIHYEWYYAYFGKEYTVSASPNFDDFHVYEGTFENGAWTSEYINISVNGESGDVLFIEPLPGTLATANFFDSDNMLDMDQDGRYFCTSSEATDLYVDFEVRIESGDGVKIYIQRNDQKLYVEELTHSIYDEVKHEIHATGTEYGNYDGEKWIGTDNGLVIYFTNERDSSLMTLEDVVGDRILLYNYDEEREIEMGKDAALSLTKGDYVLEIYKDGNGSPEAEIFITDREGKYKLTNMPKSIFDDESSSLYVDYINNGAFENGLWYPNDDTNEIDIEFDMKAGDILTVIPSEEFDGDVVLDFAILSDEIILEEKNGAYTFVADKYCDFDLELEKCENDFSAQIKLERSSLSSLVGKSEREISPSKLGYYFARVTFKDGASLNTSPVRFDACDHKYNEGKLLCDKESFCSVCGDILASVGHSFGEWAETKLATRRNGGEEARMCNDCGKTEVRATEKIGGVGIGVIFVIIAAGALLSFSSIGVSIIIFKKKSSRQ